MEWVLRTGGPARDQEVIIERPDGSRVTVLVNIAPLFDGNGALIGMSTAFSGQGVPRSGERSQDRPGATSPRPELQGSEGTTQIFSTPLICSSSSHGL